MTVCFFPVVSVLRSCYCALRMQTVFKQCDSQQPNPKTENVFWFDLKKKPKQLIIKLFSLIFFLMLNYLKLHSKAPIFVL